MIHSSQGFRTNNNWYPTNCPVHFVIKSSKFDFKSLLFIALLWCSLDHPSDTSIPLLSCTSTSCCLLKSTPLPLFNSSRQHIPKQIHLCQEFIPLLWISLWSMSWKSDMSPWWCFGQQDGRKGKWVGRKEKGCELSPILILDGHSCSYWWSVTTLVNSYIYYSKK